MAGLDAHRWFRAAADTTMAVSPSHRSQTVVFPLVQLVIVAVPVVLALLVVDALRAAKHMGGLPPFTSTYRAYGA